MVPMEWDSHCNGKDSQKNLHLRATRRICEPESRLSSPEEVDMLLVEVIGFWFLAGLGFYGVRRLAGGNGPRIRPVIPRSNGQRA